MLYNQYLSPRKGIVVISKDVHPSISSCNTHYPHLEYIPFSVIYTSKTHLSQFHTPHQEPSIWKTDHVFNQDSIFNLKVILLSRLLFCLDRTCDHSIIIPFVLKPVQYLYYTIIYTIQSENRYRIQRYRGQSKAIVQMRYTQLDRDQYYRKLLGLQRQIYTRLSECRHTDTHIHKTNRNKQTK